MFYLIYKTINTIDGKYYIGCHQTNSLNDEYYGSGKHLIRAIKKYGIESFERKILFIFDNKEDMFNKERELVNENLVKDSKSYNLKIGGSGGNPGIIGAFSGRKHSNETKEKQRQAALQQVTTDNKRRKLSENNWSKKDPEGHRRHMSLIASNPKSEEHRQKISASLKTRYKSIASANLPHFNQGKIREKIECPHCKKIGSVNGMKQWHFEKCKEYTSLV